MPATIGRYRILARLGRGAMGVVYSARDDQLERNVALKVMMADLESDPETRARFYREAQITGKLLHRNIITVFDLGEEDGRLYLVMELLSGCTLAEFMKDGESPALEQKLDLMIQTCEGLSRAHAKGIIHRDIKPSNLFVQTDGGLKILDFGIARLTSSSMTMSGMIMGTPDYMSPEQAQGKEVDARSDTFSAAGVFYYMLTGRRPFEAAALPGVLHKVVREDPLPIRAHEAPSALAQVITKGLQKDPGSRYQRCADMAADIIRFKRQFDNETRQLTVSARERFDRVIELVSTDAELQRLRERYPFFATGERDLAAMLPLGRERVAAILDELNAMETPVASGAGGSRAVVVPFEAGESASSSVEEKVRPTAVPLDSVSQLEADSERILLVSEVLGDPDDTVEFSIQNLAAFDPAATVIITPIAPKKVQVATETWTSRLRRRLNMVRADTKASVSQKPRGVGSARRP
jgi:serine/threonine protein kinase